MASWGNPGAEPTPTGDTDNTQQWRERQKQRREEVTGDWQRCRDPAIDDWFTSVAAERDCASDCPDVPDEELVGLTIRTIEDLEEDKERDMVEEAVWRYYH